VLGLRIVDLLRLRGVLRWIFGHLPRRMRGWLGLLQVRLGLMEGLIKVPEEGLQRSLEAALRLMGAEATGSTAAYLEFGVYVGTSMACMYDATRAVGANGIRLIGFDSFQGMPEGGETEERDPVWTWQPGQLYSDVRLTRANLKRLGVPDGRVELVPGWFDESLSDATRTRLGIDRASIVMMDCVLESSTRTALDFCTPLFRDRAVVFFDDWAAGGLDERGLGEKRAFEAWLADHPEMAAEPRPDLGYEKDSVAFLLTRRESTGVPAAGETASGETSRDSG
jgi:predicted O-methyltransferase YrrM